jgi:hypothetical protein
MPVQQKISASKNKKYFLTLKPDTPFTPCPEEKEMQIT